MTREFSFECQAWGKKEEKDTTVSEMTITRSFSDVGNQLLVRVLYCGICHSDLHHLDNDWQSSIYPLVPGHEIIGRVVEIGHLVTRFASGDIVGIGDYVSTCRNCESCTTHREQYCSDIVWSYDARDERGVVQFGGFSEFMVVREPYAVLIPEPLHRHLPGVAPLLCAGVTAFSAISHFELYRKRRIAILGCGGIGQLAYKILKAWAPPSCEIVVVSSQRDKAAFVDHDREFWFSTIDSTSRDHAPLTENHFDTVLDTISCAHDINGSLRALCVDGTLVLLGLPSEKYVLDHFLVLSKRLTVTGSSVGNVHDLEALLELCARHAITSDVDVITPDAIDSALTLLRENTCKRRNVIVLP